jgi:hypothetical protein
MMVLTWRFWSPAADADEWFQHCDETAVQELTRAERNSGVFVLSRTEHDETEFLLLSFWDVDDSSVIETVAERALRHVAYNKHTIRREIGMRQYNVAGRGAIALAAALSFEL